MLTNVAISQGEVVLKNLQKILRAAKANSSQRIDKDNIYQS